MLVLLSLDGWRSLFLTRLLFAAGVVLLLILIAFLNQEVWRFVIGYGAIAFFLLPMFIGVPIMVSHHHQFWFAYWLSPPLLLIALLCGWIAFTSLGWIGWLMLFYAIGTIVGVTGAVWVDKCLRTEERTQAQRRAGGASAELPHLRLWKRVRWLRLGVGVITLLGALLLLLLEPPEILGMLVTLIFAAGFVHLDAMLLCFKGPLPLVRYDSSQQRWRTTYSGRFALFVPRQNIYRLLTTPSPPVLEPAERRLLAHSPQVPEPAEGRPLAAGRDGAEIVLALLREGTLGPSIRRACALLSPTEAHRLLLHLSLQAGGAAAISYLEAALSPELHPMASQYAALASEAAKPSDLQRFLKALPAHSQPDFPPLDTEPQNPMLSPRRIRHDVSIQRLLTQVREVLLSYEFSPQQEQPYQELQQFVERIESARPQNDSPIASWPVALLQHVEAHRQRLKNA